LQKMVKYFCAKIEYSREEEVIFMVIIGYHLKLAQLNRIS